MEKILKDIYIRSPFFIKKVFANAEAIRRNNYRRSGQYKAYYQNLNLSKALENYDIDQQKKDISSLIKHVKKTIPFYKKEVNDINDIDSIPLTNKLLMRNNITDFIDDKKIRHLWNGSTSGSTGTPFNYYRDKNSMQYEYALYDRLYEYLSENDSYINARISGVNIVKAEHKKPPFWYYIRVFNQLQCSAYHIDKKTYRFYLNAFNKYNANIGTGFASSWLFLSQLIFEEDTLTPKLDCIVTDSEGITDEEKKVVEKSFKTTVYQTYGLSEVGILAVQCTNNHYHTFSNRCYIEIVDETGEVIEDGLEGEIVVTDLHSFNAPFIRYRTGDIGIIGTEDCGCGWKTPYLKELVGRVDDYILTSDNRKISRLGYVAKPARGILGMQLVQRKKGHLTINVLPAKEFDHESMEQVLKVAKSYLGNMDITWQLVDELEKTKSGKVKYVIRNIS